ncbi:hypothetical protein E4U42_001003 [Claviceps africana]|uniref:Increased rDNA silencing protein IRS4 n=1 Tax=Claviceps africana TaxID=83212 RepID=A0A8K0NHI7_9HYPO|nr:hypothetical protein E4U42_001003 [Claviceps africana]
MNHAASSRSHAVPGDAAVALRGASLAFRRNPAGGLALNASPPEEALSSSSSSSSSHRGEASRGTRCGAVGAETSAATARKNGHSSHDACESDSSGLPPGSASAQRLDAKNPSFIAATLAASRSASPGRRAPPPGLADDAVDSGSIPATGKLISLFEQGGGGGGGGGGPPGRRSPSLDARGEPLRDRKRGHERASSATALHPRPSSKPTSKPRPKPKPKPKLPPGPEPEPEPEPEPHPNPNPNPNPNPKVQPNSASRRPPSPSPPPLSGSRAETEAEAKRKRSNVVPSSTKPPTSPVRSAVRSAERSAEKISAMPMPKPKPPPHLSLPFPQATALHAPSHQPQAQPPHPVLPAPEQLEPRRKSPSPSRPDRSATPEVLSPKPVRLVRPPSLAPPVLSSPSPLPPKNGSGPRHEGTASSPGRDAENRGTTSHPRVSTPSEPRTSHRHHHHHAQHIPSTASASVSVSSRTEFGLPIVPFAPAPAPSPAPAPPPPRKALRRERLPPPPPSPFPRAGRRSSVASAPTSPVLAPRSSRRRRTITSANHNSHLPLDTLTNAMMASSLASAKLTPHNTGSSLPPPSLPQRRRSPRLLQTLRQPPGHQDDDPERVKIAHRHKVSSNKHAHHEGSRRRWRDQVTQRERKRYEAVWASNRGCDLVLRAAAGRTGRPPDESQDCVLNVVVREIWKRSRLPQDELMEVWDLVDRRGEGMLTRQEFVVGMWMIDQRLRGRKIPARVSDSVWDSVNGVRLPRLGRK